VAEACEELELDIELRRNEASLQRLLVALHRRRAVIHALSFVAGSDRDVASVRLDVPFGRVRHVLATLRREVFVLRVVQPAANDAQRADDSSWCASR
jgi:hypothetical protein